MTRIFTLLCYYVSLGMGKFQLLQSQNSTKSDDYKGIKLPAEFTPSSCQILVEPTIAASRAVVLLISKFGSGFKYLIVQLKVMDDDRVAFGNDRCNVLGNIHCLGSLCEDKFSTTDPSTKSIHDISGVFLVGAGFQYDFESPKGSDRHNDKYVAILGVLHNNGQSLCSLCLGWNKKSIKDVFCFRKMHGKSGVTQLVQKVWTSEVISRPGQRHTMDFFSNMAFSLNGGNTFVWSVPFNKTISEFEKSDPITFGPVHVLPDDNPEQSRIFLGSLPLVSDRFLVFSSQVRRKYRRNIQSSNSQSAEPEEFSIYRMSDLIVGAPCFAPSLIFQLSKRSVNDVVSKRIDKPG